MQQLFAKLPKHLLTPDPSLYTADDFTVVDFETTTVEFGSPHRTDNSLILATWINGPDHPRPGAYELIGNETDMAPLVRDVEDAGFLVAHNSKFELGWLDRSGLDLSQVVSFCTQIGEKVLAGNRQWRLSLDACLTRRGWSGKDRVGLLIQMGWDTLSIPTNWLMRYCRKDTAKTLQLFLDQRRELASLSLLPVTYTRNLLTPVLYDIEGYGLHLDPQRVDLVYRYYVREDERLSTQFASLTDGVNPKSTLQKRELLYDRLGLAVPRDAQNKEMLTGKLEPMTSAAALAALKLTTKEQREVVATLVELTKTRDALSKYISSLKQLADTNTNLTCTYTQTVTATHRLSSRGRSSGIQLQNFQRRFRPTITARHSGWLIGDGDAAGLEFRTAIDLAKDEQGLKDIVEGVDVHANTAKILSANTWDDTIGPKEGTNDLLRTRAKADTFKPLYGGQSGTTAQRQYYTWFKQHYKATADMQHAWTGEVARTKQLRMASGLIFYWADCQLTDRGYITYTTQIYNFPVQSFATADLAPTATVYLWHLMRVAGMESFLVNLVHDSAVGEIHPDETDLWAELLTACFDPIIRWVFKEVYDYTWTTPLATEVKFSPHWGDSKEWCSQWE